METIKKKLQEMHGQEVVDIFGSIRLHQREPDSKHFSNSAKATCGALFTDCRCFLARLHAFDTCGYTFEQIKQAAEEENYKRVKSLFFVGLNPRWQQYRFIPNGLNVMYSAAGFWDGTKWRRKRFQRHYGLRWLDCGGFTLLNQYGDYPFTVVNYANLQAFLSADFYATMDYPCEPEISRTLGLTSNYERIQATVENALKLMEWESHLPGQLVPVVQGYTLEEYQHCIKLYQQAGAIRDYMAIGSMCRRISTAEINRLIPGIYHAAQQAGAKRLHFFGLKLSPDLIPLEKYIWSRDSAVAMDDYDNELRKQRGGRRWPRGQKEKRAVFMAFLNRLATLNLRYRLTNQCTGTPNLGSKSTAISPPSCHQA